MQLQVLHDINAYPEQNAQGFAEKIGFK